MRRSGPRHGSSPARGRFVHAFDGKNCGVPIRTGHFWLQSIPDAHAVVTLDITDPEHPREVSRITFGDDEGPHWLAIDPAGTRIVVNSGGYVKGNRLFVLNFNPANGQLTMDGRFRDRGQRSRRSRSQREDVAPWILGKGGAAWHRLFSMILTLT